jgi:hypothetical protein
MIYTQIDMRTKFSNSDYILEIPFWFLIYKIFQGSLHTPN